MDQPLDLVILAAPGDRGVADPLAPAASESLGLLNPLRTWAPGPGAVAGDRAAPATVADLAVLGAPVDVRAGP